MPCHKTIHLTIQEGRPDKPKQIILYSLLI